VSLVRENMLARRAPFRETRQRILVCGGQGESAYLAGLYTLAANPAVIVRPAPEPVTADEVIALAEEYRRRHPDEVDQVWCAVDAEDVDLGALRARAVEADVELAVSNPSFELWLLLHHLERSPGRLTRDTAVRMLRQYLPDYDRMRLDFADFQKGLGLATDLARSLETGEMTNPSSGIWRLVTRIFGKKRIE
jgi:RloB-like protein